jgi:hypothetical protein
MDANPSGLRTLWGSGRVVATQFPYRPLARGRVCSQLHNGSMPDRRRELQSASKGWGFYLSFKAKHFDPREPLRIYARRGCRELPSARAFALTEKSERLAAANISHASEGNVCNQRPRIPAHKIATCHRPTRGGPPIRQRDGRTRSEALSLDAPTLNALSLYSLRHLWVKKFHPADPSRSGITPF